MLRNKKLRMLGIAKNTKIFENAFLILTFPFALSVAAAIYPIPMKKTVSATPSRFAAIACGRKGLFCAREKENDMATKTKDPGKYLNGFKFDYNYK